MSKHIILTDTIEIFNNTNNINMIDKSLFDIKEIHNSTLIKLCNNFCIESTKLNIMTNYNYNHVLNNFIDDNNLSPTPEIIDKFFTKHSNVVLNNIGLIHHPMASRAIVTDNTINKLIEIIKEHN